MSIKPNKEGVDWRLIKAELNARIAQLQEEMLNPLTSEEYNRCRGGILLAKELIEWVEPTAKVTEAKDDGYGFSGGEGENYT